MTIINLPTTSQNVNNQNCSFQIPLNASSNVIYYNFANSAYDQYIENTDNNFILDKLIIK